jgi:hypothetical protein
MNTTDQTTVKFSRTEPIKKQAVIAPKPIKPKIELEVSEPKQSKINFHLSPFQICYIGYFFLIIVAVIASAQAFGNTPLTFFVVSCISLFAMSNLLIAMKDEVMI